MGRRTSRRTSRRPERRVVPNERLWTADVSPLDYTPLGMPLGSVQRVAMVDTEAPPIPTEVSPFFKQRYSSKVRTKKGDWKELKKPKLVDPGAPPNTVAFIDYTIYGKPGNQEAYVFYMGTRTDLRGKGYGRDLLERFMLSVQAAGVRYVNFGKVLNERMWKLMQIWVEKHRAGTYGPNVHGKHYF